jgi:hypothetical protein
MVNRKVVKVEEEDEDIIVQFNGLMSGNEDIRSRMSACKFFVSLAAIRSFAVTTVTHVLIQMVLFGMKQRIGEDEPVAQIGNQMFRGSVEPIMGTAVCFQEQATDKNESPQKKSLSFISKTEKVLVMKRVFLQPKKSNPSDGHQSTTSQGQS